jgi:DNA replication protein DnaC
MADSQVKTIGQVLRTTAFFETEQHTCETHGEFRDTMMPNGKWTGCTTCYAEHRELERLEAKRQAEEYEREERLRAARVPKRFREATLESFVPSCDAAKKALNLATSYADDFDQFKADGTCMIFCGGVGTGKTHLAVGIIKRVLDRNMRARFSSVIDAVRSVKETYGRDSEKTEQEAIDEFLRPALLVLDEVGAQFGTDAEKLILFQIINGRYEKVLPTIVISNLAKDALGEFIGERVIDRLRENGGRLIAFDWASHRRNAAKE